MMNVYFDYRVLGEKVYYGVFMEDEVEEGDVEFLDYVTTEEASRGGNVSSYNYEYSLLAFKHAIIVAEEYGLEDVCFMNQNQLIFDWVMNNKREKRDEVGLVVDNLNRMTLAGVVSAYTVIASKDNKAKKRLKKMKSSTGKNIKAKGRIGLIGQSPRAEVQKPKNKGVSATDIVNRLERNQRGSMGHHSK